MTTQYTKAFADGMQYLLARFSHIVAQDPVALNRAMVEIDRAVAGNNPPHLIEVPWTTVRKPWRAEYQRLRELSGRPNEPADLGARPRGRPPKSEVEWTETGA